MLYFDNNATTMPCEAAVQEVRRATEELWHNPSSVHRPGQAARAAVELARRDLATLVGAQPRDLILTSSGTESIDLAIRGVLASSKRRVLVTTAVEHAAVRDLSEHLGRRGVEVRTLPLLPGGRVDVASLGGVIDESVAMVSVQWANNETGLVQPVAAIAAAARAAGAVMHCDGVQWVGKETTDVRAVGIDLLSYSAHKFHGIKGCGVLWVRPGVRLAPTIMGTQELGRRGGTEAVPAILAAGGAARAALAWLSGPGGRSGVGAARDLLESRIRTSIPDAVINGGGERVWNTTNIGFPGLQAEALLMLLSERGVCASAGAACSSGSLEPSPVLLAMGVPERVAHGSIRLSLSRYTTEREVEECAAAVAACVRTLRASGGV
ncbi:MAG: cysteine desulfurase [Leptolyngbya sp. PLA1]|nr:cysteine desulfurase [Leptolyngbya sp. PLA1]